MSKIPLNQLIKSKILIRVYFIWFFRRIIPLILIQVAALVFALKIFANNVFVSKVLQNVGVVSEAGYWSVLKYLALSFAQTHFVIQLIILLGLGFGALLLRDIIRSIITYVAMKRQDR